MPSSRKAHVVAVIAFDGVVGFNLTIPSQVFGAARGADLSRLYDVRVCGPASGVTAMAYGAHTFDLKPPNDLEAALAADTVPVPGSSTPLNPWPREAVEVVQAASARGARIVSICTGAFLLAT